MAVVGAIAAVASAVVTGVEASSAKREAKRETRRQENEQERLQVLQKEEDDRDTNRRNMVAARARQRALAAWDAPKQALGSGNTGSGTTSNTLLGM